MSWYSLLNLYHKLANQISYLLIIIWTSNFQFDSYFCLYIQIITLNTPTLDNECILGFERKFVHFGRYEWYHQISSLVKRNTLILQSNTKWNIIPFSGNISFQYLGLQIDEFTWIHSKINQHFFLLMNHHNSDFNVCYVL